MLRSDRAVFFGKILAWPILVNRGHFPPENGPFLIIAQSCFIVFRDILHGVKGKYRLKPTLVPFFGKILVWRILANFGQFSPTNRRFR